MGHLSIHRGAVAPFVSPKTFSWPEETVPTLVGSAAFGMTLSLSTWIQAKLRISTGTTKPIPSILGLGSVAIASIICHFVSIQAFQLSKSNSIVFDWNSSNDESLFFVNYLPTRIQIENTPFDAYHPFELSKSLEDIDLSHSLRIIALGIIAYKCLGGRFWAVSPSSYTHLGSFARRTTSLPATDAYATKTERQIINRLGKIHGCHTCGDRMFISEGLKSGTKFIADHIPPKAAMSQMRERWYRKLFRIEVKQRFYPQCVKCSLKQSNILSDASRKYHLAANAKKGFVMKRVPNLAQSGGGSNAYVHGIRLRREHLAGALIATATVKDSDELDVMSGNRVRFREWQLHVQDFLVAASSFVKTKISS
mmetsp:Transcript_942/g.1458  ORF Transcript_942/g.1458 Transcript_942/m.1458 type:complete len:366 (+) Transcript_942:111-1208(+)